MSDQRTPKRRDRLELGKMAFILRDCNGMRSRNVGIAAKNKNPTEINQWDFENYITLNLQYEPINRSIC